jgi:hypothetical protein
MNRMATRLVKLEAARAAYRAARRVQRHIINEETTEAREARIAAIEASSGPETLNIFRIISRAPRRLIERCDQGELIHRHHIVDRVNLPLHRPQCIDDQRKRFLFLRHRSLPFFAILMEGSAGVESGLLTWCLVSRGGAHGADQ